MNKLQQCQHLLSLGYPRAGGEEKSPEDARGALLPGPAPGASPPSPAQPGRLWRPRAPGTLLSGLQRRVLCVCACLSPSPRAGRSDGCDITPRRRGGTRARFVPGLGGAVRLLGGVSRGSQACFHLPDLPRCREGLPKAPAWGEGPHGTAEGTRVRDRPADNV